MNTSAGREGEGKGAGGKICASGITEGVTCVRIANCKRKIRRSGEGVRSAVHGRLVVRYTLGPPVVALQAARMLTN